MRLVLALLACLGFVGVAQAQQTKAQLNTSISTNFPDNTLGLITPLNLRTVSSSIVNSIMATAPVVNGNLACFDGVTSLLKDCGVTSPPTFTVPFTANLPLVATGPGTVGQGTRTGNTTNYATSTGPLTNGDCVKIDANGNFVDSGASCGAGTNAGQIQNFVAGTGFTPGTTTSLTLSSSPTNAQQLLIAFDGMVQSHNTWSLAGAVVTFNVAIPANVSVVEAQWMTSTSTAGVGSLTDSAGNVAAGAVMVLPPFSTAGNTIGPGGACVFKTRTAAAAANLTTCNVVITGGYANPGDGGGGTFQNIGSSPLLDSGVVSLTITGNGGSGCTGPGTVIFPSTLSGSGRGVPILVTITGGIVTNTFITGNKGNYYKVGDTLSAVISGCVSTTTYTVASIVTPTCSFVDGAGNNWQLQEGTAGYNVRQCGAKIDRSNVSTDGAATNDYTAIQNTLNLAGSLAANGSTPDGAGGKWGGRVYMPAGVSLICSSVQLQVPFGVEFYGASMESSKLQPCTTWPSAFEVVDLCDPTWHVACFGAHIHDLMVDARNTSGTAAVIFSNNMQQSEIVTRVTVYSGFRTCVQYTIGYGGAADVGIDQLWCTETNGGSAPGVDLRGIGTVVVWVTRSVIEANGLIPSSGIIMNGGWVKVQNVNVGLFQNGVQSSTPLNSGFLTAENVTGGGPSTGCLIINNGGGVPTVQASSLAFNGYANTTCGPGGNSGAVNIGPWTNF